MDAQDWLTRHRAGHFVPDRVCPGLNNELIGAGDVMEDGSIMALSGIIVTGGNTIIYLTERKRAAAEYYGWRYHPGFPNERDSQGRPTYPMHRPLPR